MTLQEKIALPDAMKKIKHNCSDEAQSWFGNTWYSFKKVERHWEVLDCQTYTDEEIKFWDFPWLLT